MCTKHQDKISAEKNSIGFDFQFLYFIYNLIALEPNQVVGYEVKDDVHLELPTGEHIYMQLKHSLNTKANGETENLTEKDIDLWKTIYNWLVIISETSNEQDIQLKFIANTTFIMVTNKSDGGNPFVQKVIKFKNKLIDSNEFKQYVQKLKDSCKGEKAASVKLKLYIDKMLQTSNNILEAFILKMDFNFNFNSVQENLTNRILAKNIDARFVESALHEIIGTFELWKFNKVKNNQKILIDFDMVDKKIKPILQKARSKELPRRKGTLIIPTELKSQAFIKELLLIDDIDEEDDKLMLQFTTYKMEIFNLINQSIADGYITEVDQQELEEEAITIWINKHRKVHKKNINIHDITQLNISAQQCIDDLREKKLSLSYDVLSIQESNGLFYSLSDVDAIGWQYKWKEKY